MYGGMSDAADPRRRSPAAARNRDPILNLLRRALPAKGLVLEVASGGGEHALHFARALPDLLWQPSDPDPQARASIAAWRAQAALPNLHAPLDLDVTRPAWPIARADAVVAINLTHIAPWRATLGLLRGAARLLGPGAPLVLYGPFRQHDRPLAASNAAFDADLQGRDPGWGLRLAEEIADEADEAGFRLEQIAEMPANNLTLIFRRR